jgi:hypothetical protein
LPNTITYAPHGSKDEYNSYLISGRLSNEHGNNERIVDESSNNKTWPTADDFNDLTKSETTDRITHAIANHDDTDIFGIESACDKALFISEISLNLYFI